MIPPEVITVLVAAARAAGEALPALLSMLTDDGREAVLEALARDRDALDSVPSTTAAIEEAIARHESRVRAHQQARAESVRGRYGISDTALLALERAARHAQTDAESDDLTAVRHFVEAAHRGELVAALPRVLDAPAGAWSEPGGEP